MMSKMSFPIPKPLIDTCHHLKEKDWQAFTYPNFKFLFIEDSWDSPDFYLLFLNGNQDSPNLSFASID